MKQKRVGGLTVAVYPAHIPQDGKVHVGAWVCRRVLSGQRARLMSLNETAGLGHVRVCSRAKKTTVMYIGPAAGVETEKHRTPRQIAVRIGRAIEQVVGTRFIVRRLRNTELVSRALA